ncbi:alpha-ketoglutarate-dependent dioxygenase AlkB family protein [Chitinophagaceae bacterium MMS25-I14]
MEQLSFFDDQNKIDNPLLADLIDYRPGMFSPAESNYFLQKFTAEVTWEQRAIVMYGKEMLTPRLTAWYGDDVKDHTAMGTSLAPAPWTSDLLTIRKRVETAAGIHFDSVLLNYYRDGNDSVAWHDDEDNIPGKNRIVASVSFGQERMFDFRKKTDHSVKYSILLQNGSYLLMKGNLQREWEHRIAKSSKPMKARINLTFRISKPG